MSSENGGVMIMKVVVEKGELESFLHYLADKADDVYEREVAQAVERFLKEQVNKLNGN
jgi:hypothetical protein